MSEDKLMWSVTVVLHVRAENEEEAEELAGQSVYRRSDSVMYAEVTDVEELDE